MQAERKKPAKSGTKKTKKKVISKKEVQNEPEAPIRHTIPPSAPAIDEDLVQREIEESSMFQIEQPIEEKSNNNNNVNICYPALHSMLNPPIQVNVELETETPKVQQAQPQTQSLQLQDIKNAGFVITAINSFCNHCTEKLGDTITVVSKCGHAQHLECCIPKIEAMNANQVCSMCVAYNIKPKEQEKPNAEEKEEEEDIFTFKIDNGNDPETRKMNERIMRKQKLKNPLLFFEVGSIPEFEVQEEQEEEDKKKRIMLEKPDDYEIDLPKIYDLLKRKGIIQTSNVKGAWDSVMSAFGYGQISSYVKGGANEFSYNFLIENKITLDDLVESGFNMDDIYWEIGATTISELKALGLHERHFSEDSIFKDFETFIERYNPNVHEIDRAMTVHSDWLLRVCDNDPTLLRRLDIDFDYLIQKLFFDKDELKPLKWTIDQCKMLGMESKHLLALKLNPLDFIEMGWRDLDNIVIKFNLNEREKGRLGIKDKLKSVLEPEEQKTKIKGRRRF